MKKIKKFTGLCLIFFFSLFFHMVSVFAGQGLKINSELLRSMQETLYADEPGLGKDVRADELIIGIGEQGFTPRELKACLEAYGTNSNIHYGIETGYIYCVVQNLEAPEFVFQFLGLQGTIQLDKAAVGTVRDAVDADSMAKSGYDYQDNPFFDILVRGDTLINICLMSTDIDDEIYTTEDLARFETMLEVIDQVDHGVQPNTGEGWVFEDGAWRYLQGGVRVTGFRYLNNELYCFDMDGSLIHDTFRELNGRKYHFNGNWADRGWQLLEENGETNWYCFETGNPSNGYQNSDGAAKTGYVNGIEEDSFQYFFWTDGYTDQNGRGHLKGTLACGNEASDMWILHNGSPIYVADKSGHLYTDMQKDWNGQVCNIDGEGNVTLAGKYAKIDYSERGLIRSQKQENSADCGITSIAAMYGYHNTDGINDTWTPKQIYDKVRGMNNNSDYVNWGNYSPHFDAASVHNVNLENLYEHLQNGAPFIISYWNGQNGNGYRGHYSLCVGYNGNSVTLERSGFQILDVYDHTVKRLDTFESYYVKQGCRLYSIVPMD